MKWLLIVTLFSVDAEPLRVSTPYSTEEICNKAGTYYVARVAENDSEVVATFKCVPKSDFVVK